MKVLVVVSGNHGRVAPFVAEQAEALRQAGCEVAMYQVAGHGIRGYLGNLHSLKATIRQFQPDIVHAHYGLCGLLCTLQHLSPVVITYHGSDINDRHILPFSRMAMCRARHNIFVSKVIRKTTHRSSVLPCGINLETLPIIDRMEARKKMNLQPDGRYVLFAGAFSNTVKNAPLAHAACAQLHNVTLLELTGYTREEVALLMNACDALLMTSFNEGSPQVVKEALATGLPVVTVNVGDVSDIIGDSHAGTIVDRTPEGIASVLAPILDHPYRSGGRRRIQELRLDNKEIAQQLIEIYTQCLR